jgi:hypothetical protein
MSQDRQERAIQHFGAIVAEARRFSVEASAFFRIVRGLSTVDGCADLKRVERSLQKLAAMRLDPGNLADGAMLAAEDASKWLSEEWQRRAALFGEELSRYLTERSIPAVLSSERVYARPFYIQIDGNRDRAELTFAGEPVGKPVPLSSPVVYRAYTDAEKQLKRGETRPEQFAEELVEGYRDACKLRAAREGARVRLPDVHFALFVRRQTAAVRSDPRSRKILEYPRYQFAWDLGLLQEHPKWLERHHIKLHEASDTAARGKANSVRLVARDGGDTVFGDMQVTVK